MKILIYGINFAPELTGIGKYTGDMAAWLAARGHAVRVVTAPPYYPAWKVGAGYSAGQFRHETWQGVAVWRCPVWVPARLSGARRLVHLASFALSSVPVLLRHALWRPQVVWVVAPALFCAPGAWAVARLSGARAWLHIQDFEVDAAFELGLLKGERVRGWVQRAERWLMRRFDVVSSISARMVELLLDKDVAQERAVLFPNWVNVNAITPQAGPNAFRTALGIAPETVVALYSGNMGGKQGLELLGEAAALLRDHANVAFVFCGDGAGRLELVDQCQGLPNVRFLPLQPFEQLSALLGMADIHLLPQRAEAADLVMPSKLTGMLSSGRAVVATAHVGSAVAQVVAQCGLVVPPGDARAMADAIATLAAQPELRTRLGAAARYYAEAHLDQEPVLLKFEAQLQRMATGSALP